MSHRLRSSSVPPAHQQGKPSPDPCPVSRESAFPSAAPTEHHRASAVLELHLLRFTLHLIAAFPTSNSNLLVSLPISLPSFFLF